MASSSVPVRGLDSSAPPSAAQVAAARAAGFGAWLGYLGRAGDNLLHPWTQADFATVRAGGLRTGAFCSGVDDPGWVRQTAAAWDVGPIILDVESGIRGDGPWVAGWLEASGAGLYGGYQVMAVHVSDPAIPFFVVCAYPDTGTQTAAWDPRCPAATAKPTGWQWAGTVSLFGLYVDLANYDPAILADPPSVPEETVMPALIAYNGQYHTFDVDPSGDLVHRWYDPTVEPRVWRKETVASGCVPSCAPAATCDFAPGQVHVFAALPDGSQQHCWFPLGDPPAWGAEVI